MDTKRTSPPVFARPGYAADYIKTDATEASFHDDPHVDNLMIIAYALATELWAERDRSRVVESLLSRGEKVTSESIEKYMPTDEERDQWQADQDAMVQRVFGVLTRNTAIGRDYAEPRFKDRG
jgi:hypothetical protein